MAVSIDQIKAAAEGMRRVMMTLPIEYAADESCPTDALMNALGVLQELADVQATNEVWNEQNPA